ncbi:hypothetical protein [Mucilaginibacter sp.]|uniref:hypothetical protein n=1 Tax=Mucilaginibacter sp. TaxID=1882438 RepID=UPI0026007587|nr:hypothetical protein [Mucilaginibacter sp.]
MKIEALLHKGISSLTMPVSGTITKMADIGDIGRNSLDGVKNRSENLSDGYYLEYDASTNVIEFQTNVFSEEVRKLSEEFNTRYDALFAFRKDFDSLSLQAVEDPFLPAKFKDSARINNSIALLLSILWNNQISSLANDIPEETYPVLEKRISALLSETTIAFCSALISLDKGSTRLLACKEIANEIRRRELFNGLYSDEVSHPTALFQKIRINDPVFYQEQIIYVDYESINSLMYYPSKIKEYWENIALKKLYNEDDIAALKAWGVIQNKKADLAGLLPAAEDIPTPFTKLENAYDELYDVRIQIDNAIKATKEIGNVGFNVWLSGGWPATTEVLPEERSLWVAKCAVANLGLPAEEANKYGSCFDGLLGFIIKYITTPNKAIPIAKNHDQDGKLVPHLFFAGDIEGLLTFIIPHAASDYISAVMEFKIKSIFGGTTVKLLQAYTSADLQNNPFDQRGNISDLPQGIQIYNDLLVNPRLYEDQINNLRIWRDNFEQNNVRTSIPNDDVVIDDYYRFNKSRSYLEKNRKSFDSIFSKIDKIRIALTTVDAINNVQKIFDSLTAKLNSDYINLGYLKIPLDSKVVSRIVSIGEFVTEGKPIATIIDRFRCDAQAFITQEDMSDLPVLPMSVWKVAINGVKTIGDNIFFSCIVKRVEPVEGKSWKIDLEMIASVNFSVEGILNFQEFLPLSSRFLNPVIVGISEDILIQAEQAIPNQQLATIEFLEKIF